MKHERLIWTGDRNTSLEQFRDVDVLSVESDTLYYSSLFRFLTLLLRSFDIELILTSEMEETARNSGFDNLLNE